MLAGPDPRNFAAPIRQIPAGIAVHAITAPTDRVFTQPGPKGDMGSPEVNVDTATTGGAAFCRYAAPNETLRPRAEERSGA